MADGIRQVGDRPADPARLTPYELAFLEGDFESRVFPAIEAEAAERGEDPAQRERFTFIGQAGDAVRDIIPEDAPPEMLEEYRALFYHAFNFWRAGRRTYVLDAPVARYLVESSPRLDAWTFAVPAPAFYLQLPANLFWASITPELPPEPVDGFFVTVARQVDARGEPFDDLQGLMVLGIHRNRPGFSVIPFDAVVGAGIPAVWAEPGREEGRDFENVLPGGDMAGLYSILTTSEALKLIALAAWYIGQNAADVTPEAAADLPPDDGIAPVSRMDILRVRFGGGPAA